MKNLGQTPWPVKHDNKIIFTSLVICYVNFFKRNDSFHRWFEEFVQNKRATTWLQQFSNNKSKKGGFSNQQQNQLVRRTYRSKRHDMTCKLSSINMSTRHWFICNWNFKNINIKNISIINNIMIYLSILNYQTMNRSNWSVLIVKHTDWHTTITRKQRLLISENHSVMLSTWLLNLV